MSSRPMAIEMDDNEVLMASRPTRRTLYKEEDHFDHVGFGHLDAIGSASASLALIGTLVFSLCISLMGGTRFSDGPIQMTLYCVSTSFSIYTTCYSILEYYYIQMFIGVERYLEGRVSSKNAEDLSADEDNTSLLKDRALLVREVRTIFATFNTMRGAARNSMWLGLLCLVMASSAEVSPFKGEEGLLEEEWLPSSPSGEAFMFFFVAMLIVCPAWYITRSPDFAMHSCICLGGLLSTAADEVWIHSGWPVSRLVAFAILLSTVFLVPYTVLSFRGPLLTLVKKYVNVF